MKETEKFCHFLFDGNSYYCTSTVFALKKPIVSVSRSILFFVIVG